MKLIGLIIARNSEWCLRASATAALRWCDELVILDHASDDGTPQIIDAVQDAHPGRVARLRERSPVWREMAHRQLTLDAARQLLDATHCAIVDDDEILTENLVPRIRDMIEALSPGQCLQLPWLSLWRSLDAYRADASAFGLAWKSMAFADGPGICWQAPAGYDHHHTHPYGCSFIRPMMSHADGGWMHLQHACWRRVVAKQLWYVLQETQRWGQVRANYAGTLDEAGLQTAAVPAGWWGLERKLIDLGAEPWQAAECRRMLREDADCGRLVPAEMWRQAREAGAL